MTKTAPCTHTWIENTLRLPSDSPEDWLTESYRFQDTEIRLTRPRNPDGLLDDPSVQSASRANDYMPYWAFVWPGAILLAQKVLSARWPRGAGAVEIGCGLGLAGIAALKAGLHVTFTDYSPAALALAAYNARLNGLEKFETRAMDWLTPPHESFEAVLGADVLYETRCLTDVLRVLDSVLAPHGVALLSDPGRAVADPFEELAWNRGYQVECEPFAATAPSGTTIQGRVFRLSWTAQRQP